MLPEVDEVFVPYRLPLYVLQESKFSKNKKKMNKISRTIFSVVCSQMELFEPSKPNKEFVNKKELINETVDYYCVHYSRAVVVLFGGCCVVGH